MFAWRRRGRARPVQPEPAVPLDPASAASSAAADGGATADASAPPHPSTAEAAWPVTIGDGGATAAVVGMPGLVGSDVPDCLIDWGRVGSLEARAASVRGRSHRYKNTARQDHFDLGLTDDGAWLLLAVADGVSTSPCSDQAARVACDAAIATLKDLSQAPPIEGIDWSVVVESARIAVLDQARTVMADPDLEPRAAADIMATTLVVAAVRVDAGDDGRRPCIVVAIGDTSAWVLRDRTTWTSLTAIKNEGEEIAQSDVFALPLDTPGRINPFVDSLGAGDVFFAFTDGIGDPLGDGAGLVGDELAEQWADPPSPYDFGRWVDFARKTHVDDRTAVGVWAPVSTEESAG